MRRACALGTCAALLLAATALAATKNYSGTVDGGGNLQLRIKTHRGHTKLTRFDFQHVTLRCAGKSKKATGNLSFTRPVNDREFTIRGVNSEGGVIRVNGKLRKHGRAKGTIRLDGAIHVDGTPGFAHNCHSGVEDWTAKRG